MSLDNVIKSVVRKVLEDNLLEEDDCQNLMLELRTLVDWATNLVRSMLSELEEDIILESFEQHGINMVGETAELVVYMHLGNIVDYIDATFYSK